MIPFSSIRRSLLGSCVLVVSSLFAVTAYAEKSKVSDYKLHMVSWGEALEGDEGVAFDASKLEGKIVVVEEFGVKTPVCIGRLKDLARLQKKLEKEESPVVIVAIHRQRDVADADVLAATRRARVNFALRKNGFLPASIGGMPHAAIFLPDGSMAWHGDSTERDFDKALQKAMEK